MHVNNDFQIITLKLKHNHGACGVKGETCNYRACRALAQYQNCKHPWAPVGKISRRGWEHGGNIRVPIPMGEYIQGGVVVCITCGKLLL